MRQKDNLPETGAGRQEPKHWFSLAGALNAALSVIFLVLAAYIMVLASSAPAVAERQELRYFALLVGAYGVWRMIRTIRRANARRDDE